MLECATSQFDDAAGLLFDAHVPGDLPGGTGQRFDWARLPRKYGARPLCCRADSTPPTSRRRSREVRPYAVDVSSGVEERDADGRPRRGLKDAARIAAFSKGCAVQMHDDVDNRGGNRAPPTTCPTRAATSGRTAACSSPRR